MSSYLPPTEELPIFNPEVFTTENEVLTITKAKKLFLRYPNAQGTENFQDINVKGVANFENTITALENSYFNDSVFITKPITSTNTISSLSVIGNNTSNNQEYTIDLINNCSQGAYNPIVQNNDNLILGKGMTNGDNNNTLTISIWNNTKKGIRISNNETEIDDNNLVFSNSNAPTSNQTLLSPSDSSNKIPTTQWVQSVINSSGNTKNNINIVPTSISTVSTAGIFNEYNISGSIGYYSNQSFTAGGSWFCSNPLCINIQTDSGLLPQPPNTPSFNPMSHGIKLHIDCFCMNNNTTGNTTTDIIIFPAACYSVSQTGYSGWGFNGSNGNFSYKLNGSINNSTGIIVNDSSYATFGRQYWTYNYSSSITTSYLGMIPISGGLMQIRIFFGGFTASTNPNEFYISANITSSDGATLNNSGVYLSHN